MIKGYLLYESNPSFIANEVSFKLGLIFYEDVVNGLNTKFRTKTDENEYYVVYNEVIDGSDYGSDDIDIESTYSHDGGFIGDLKTAKMLAEKGIHPELVPGYKICFIGKSDKDGKWWGWSHRAIYGFKPGDVVKKGDCCEHYLPVGFIAKDENGAKKMAIAFARSVS